MIKAIAADDLRRRGRVDAKGCGCEKELGELLDWVRGRRGWGEPAEKGKPLTLCLPLSYWLLGGCFKGDALRGFHCTDRRRIAAHTPTRQLTETETERASHMSAERLRF